MGIFPLVGRNARTCISTVAVRQDALNLDKAMNIHGMLPGSRTLATVGFPTCEVEVERTSMEKLLERYGMAFIRNNHHSGDFTAPLMIAKSPRPPRDIRLPTATGFSRRLYFHSMNSTWQSRDRPVRSSSPRRRDLCITTDLVLERRLLSMNRLRLCAWLIFLSVLIFSVNSIYRKRISQH